MNYLNICVHKFVHNIVSKSNHERMSCGCFRKSTCRLCFHLIIMSCYGAGEVLHLSSGVKDLT